VVRQIVDVWVDYQLLGHAAAINDSLNAPKDRDQALWAIVGQAKAKKLFESLFKGDTAANAQKYNAGDLLSAKHILVALPRGDTSRAALDSVHKKALALRAKVTPANFADLAQQNSQDPGSARKGGELGVFPKGAMVPEFEQALVATPEGQLAPGVIKTQFGYHIIYRPKYDEVKAQVAQMSNARAQQTAESTYFARLDSTGKIEVKSNGGVTAKAVATDIDGHRADNTVIATSVAGTFTAARLAQWLSLFPAQQRAQLAQLPDTAVPAIIKNFVRNELVLRAADSAKVMVDSVQMDSIKHNYEGLITNAWVTLGIDPKLLGDSAKTAAGRERVASAHIESYLDKLLAQTPGVRFVDIPSPIEGLLRAKYSSAINEAGLDRALAKATAERKEVDSSRTAREPASAVPLPGSVPPSGPSAGGPPPKH
jgi:hypothetical protein